MYIFKKCYICPSSRSSTVCSEGLGLIQSEKLERSEDRFIPSRLLPQLSQEDMLKLEVFLESSTQLGSWNAISKKIYFYIIDKVVPCDAICSGGMYHHQPTTLKKDQLIF